MWCVDRPFHLWFRGVSFHALTPLGAVGITWDSGGGGGGGAAGRTLHRKCRRDAFNVISNTKIRAKKAATFFECPSHVCLACCEPVKGLVRLVMLSIGFVVHLPTVVLLRVLGNAQTCSGRGAVGGGEVVFAC